MDLVLMAVLSCPEAAQLARGVERNPDLSGDIKKELVWEIKQAASPQCRFKDANAD